MAYDRLEPIGPAAEWRRWAEMMAQQANIARDPAKRPQPYTAADFLPKWETPEDLAPAPLNDAAAQLRSAWGMRSEGRA